jgi:hypothetical protein
MAIPRFSLLQAAGSSTRRSDVPSEYGSWNGLHGLLTTDLHFINKRISSFLGSLEYFHALRAPNARISYAQAPIEINDVLQSRQHGHSVPPSEPHIFADLFLVTKIRSAKRCN